MDAKYRGKKKEGLDDNWKGMKVNPVYNTSSFLKGALDKITGATSKGKKKDKK